MLVMCKVALQSKSTQIVAPNVYRETALNHNSYTTEYPESLCLALWNNRPMQQYSGHRRRCRHCRQQVQSSSQRIKHVKHQTWPTPSPSLHNNSPDLHQSQEQPLAKVGWTYSPQSIPRRHPCTQQTEFSTEWNCIVFYQRSLFDLVLHICRIIKVTLARAGSVLSWVTKLTKLLRPV